MCKNKNLLILDSDGYPLKISARINKNELIIRALDKKIYDIQVFSKRFVKISDTAKISGKNGNIKYSFLNYSSGNIFNLFFAYIKEIGLILKTRNNYKGRIFLISHTNAIAFIHYFFLSKLLRFRIYVILNEWHKSVNYKTWYYRLNGVMFDYLSIRLSDGLLPISRFIENKVLEKRKKSETLFLPILTDYQLISETEYPNLYEKYFLYCGGIGYIEVIEFVLRSFDLFQQSVSGNDVKLILVLSGKKKAIETFKSSLASRGFEKFVIVLSSIEYSKLISLYKNSIGLLIPLREKEQDMARFPHKIGEYLASGRPIITNNWGEVQNYLKHLHSAYIAENYDEILFASNMKAAFCDKKSATKIGMEGSIVCKVNFDYILYGEKLNYFFDPT